MNSETNKSIIESGLLSNDRIVQYMDYARDEIVEAAVENLGHDGGVERADELRKSMILLAESAEKLKTIRNSFIKIGNELPETYIYNSDDDDDLDDENQDKDVNFLHVFKSDVAAGDKKWSESDKSLHSYLGVFDRAVATVTNKSEKKDGKEGEEIAYVMEEQNSRKCPITQCEMVEPVVNVSCHHVYEKEAILAHIKQCKKRRKPAKCPFPGCQSVVTAENLKPFTTQ